MIAALILAAAGVMAYDRYGPIGAQISVEFDAAPGTFEDRDFVPGGTDTETVVIWAYPCQSRPEFEISYTDTAVVLIAREPNPHSKWCNPATLLETLDLDEPVGSRVPIDGSSGEILWEPDGPST